MLQSLEHLRHLHEDPTEPVTEAVDVIGLASGVLEDHEQFVHDQGPFLPLRLRSHLLK